MNLTLGGLFGYASSKCITRRKVPSSKGVSAGPMMTAFLQMVRQHAKIFCMLSTFVLHWHRGTGRGGNDVACGESGQSVPGHDIVGNRRCRNTSGRVCLHALHRLLLVGLNKPNRLQLACSCITLEGGVP